MAQEQTDSKIRFFGEVDLNDRTGSIRSQMPAWYFDVHISMMEEEIARKERGLALNLYEPDTALTMREEVKNEKVRLDQIINSKPNLTKPQIDKCAKAYESLGQQISETLPTRKESKDGLVSPHKELERWNKKHISINPEIAKACGVKVVRGKVSGKEAEKCYQILGKSLGENTNVERLRRDGNTEAYRSMNDLAQAILSGKPIKGV